MFNKIVIKRFEDENMEIIKIAVCDDEKIFADKLKKIIERYCLRKKISYKLDTYDSGEAFLSSPLKMMEYQIVFFDINMEGINGLETARQLRKLCKKTFIIFVTAFINYTLEGYKVNAIRYLLKEDLNFEQSVFESLDAVFERMREVPRVSTFSFREGEKSIPMEKIIYIESNLHKLTFHVFDKEIVLYTMYETLNKIAGVFPEDFIRIHQSYLVNLRFVRCVTENQLMLLNREKLPIARSKLRETRNRVTLYKGAL